MARERGCAGALRAHQRTARPRVGRPVGRGHVRLHPPARGPLARANASTLANRDRREARQPRLQRTDRGGEQPHQACATRRVRVHVVAQPPRPIAPLRETAPLGAARDDHAPLGGGASSAKVSTEQAAFGHRKRRSIQTSTVGRPKVGGLGCSSSFVPSSTTGP